MTRSRKPIYALCFLLLLVGVSIAGGKEKVEFRILNKSTSSWDGSMLPKYPEGRPEVSIVKVIIPPHTQLPLHKHPIINAGYVLRGNLTVVSKEGETLHLKPGDGIIELVNKWHTGKNEGPEEVEIVVFYAGVEGSRLSIKEE